MTDHHRVIDALTPLVAPLLALDFESRVEVAHRLGFELACCDTCGCFINAPYCHPEQDATIDKYDQCPCSREAIEESHP